MIQFLIYVFSRVGIKDVGLPDWNERGELLATNAGLKTRPGVNVYSKAVQ